MSEVGRLMRLAMVALGNAVVDIENDSLPEWQRHELASALDNLSTSLRQPERPPTVVDGAD
ncbi:uncharacterized protein YejL (UPF0352 family) [Saccharopolyspora lacisalsi]|uniref:Uncharacterized protein YejL (UPF0352 family) n=1 Tax=Halosaccharopolyspora lacisalsi TaxID=1000566 RepID=A0A839E3X8_9PSEU|nr:hypothetical protein [Halosaccharopolyspora lacisalsi]MBA8826437.1 uncharacterized protein YejL (UPF0352 family) [Halosaccharopolyspora lacisalsi]